MSKKSIAVLFVLSMLLASCIFDSDESTLGSWLGDQGLPNSYKVQTLTVGDLTPVSAEVFQDSTPRDANSRAVLGAVSGLSHDLVFDFIVTDTVLNTFLQTADSAKTSIILNLLTPFYTSKSFPQDSFPFEEDLSIKASWKITKGAKKSKVEDMLDQENSVWYSQIASWKAQNEADTTYSLKITKKDTVLEIPLPSALTADMKNSGKYYRIQLRLSAPEASRIYRFYGTASYYPPALYVRNIGEKAKQTMMIWVQRMASVFSNQESCSDCLVLHGGVFDSLVVEYPSKPIMKALSDFYGDEFPYTEGEGGDVRQAVILAELTFLRDDSQGSQELGHPIQVVVGSYIDSAKTQDMREMETYKLNKKRIASKGHPNMVFYDGDSLTLQVTFGMRDFINRASDGRTFKTMMRLGYPVLQDKDSTYANYVTAKGDSSYTFFGHFDYARYDFNTIKSSPSTLKLWLATKRGDE